MNGNEFSPPEAPFRDPQQLPPSPISGDPHRSSRNNRLRRILAVYVPALTCLTILGIWVYLGHHHSTPASQNTVTNKTQTKSSAPATSVAVVGDLLLDTSKNYGNKYASGLLPVGDGKYKTDKAQKGYVYTCSTYAQNIAGTQNAGAQSRGPWFTNNNTQYDINKKAHIAGSVSWTPSFSNKVSGSTRTIVTNDLPAHHTGVFPVASSDPAYSYDRNPNTIKAQSLSYSLTANPSYGDPQCMGGQVGVMLTGVAIFNGFDAGGRDAGAWEVQDSCSGHPEKQGEYHYHTLSSCITDVGAQTVIGFALDGFPITGPKVGTSNFLTTDDLDECHGIASQINLDGKPVIMYHYVMTQDFPYSVSCFRAKAATPPGEQQGGQQGQTGTGTGQQSPTGTSGSGQPLQPPQSGGQHNGPPNKL